MIITAISTKGGVGKTTTLMCLATLLQEKIQASNPLIIDTDPNQSAMIWDRDGGLPFTVSDSEDVLRVILTGSEQINHINTLHKFILIDSSARPSDEDIGILAKKSDLIIIPTLPDALSIKSAVNVAAKMGDRPYRILVNATLPNSTPSRKSEGDEIVTQLVGAGFPTFSRSIRRYKAYQHAINTGKTIKQAKGSSPAWQDWLALWDEIEPLISWCAIITQKLN